MFQSITSKGVSPLIATILLVAVSLSLAGILYSWASQNATSTVTSVDETQKQWDFCKGVTLNIEQGCKYDPSTGINFILYNNSTVDFDGNITIVVIGANDLIHTATVVPNFQGGAMVINSATYSPSDALNGLSEPIKLVRVFIATCKDRVALTKSCD